MVFLIFDCSLLFGVQEGTVNQMYYFIIIFKKDWFMFRLTEQTNTYKCYSRLPESMARWNPYPA